MKIPLVFVLISFSIELVAVYGKPELSADLPIPETIDALQKRIASFQAQEDRNYTPPITWATSKGAYQSDIHLNWQGSPFLALARDNLACYDTNSFSSIWITTVLIEAYKYGVAPRPNDDQMMLALDAISAFHNKNNPAGDGDMNFWLQIYNKTSDMWISHPENVYEGVEFIHKYTPFRLLESILKYFDWEAGLEILDFFKSAEAYFSAFLIPSDFDDTYLNIGMGAILKNCQKDFPTLYNTWSKQNTNYQTAFQDLKKFAYRPMSEELDENAIDTRTYYYLRGFLQEAKENSQSVSLITTWVQNIAEERYLSYEGVSMPFHINNVDTTVAANSIYGLTSAVLYDLSSDSSWFDNDIQAIYANSTSLIVWLINHNVIEERPDLALTYYPSRYSFYYYVARTLFILETKYANDGELPFEVLDQMRMNLKRALQGKVSKMIQSEAILDYDDMIFFEEFIGNGDTDLSGQPLKRGEDRLFSTSMVINFYIATWTTQNKATGKLDWAEDYSILLSSQSH
ncbi:uncharacterized protein [Antedon mediterranea]|uniref:uncharacterized protein isoform X2 n=1 Tax=Antedon mediterranea TaxID=105859 RepID=UPI003AF67B60